MIRRWIAEDREASQAQAVPKPAPAPPSPSAPAAVGPFVPVQIGAAMGDAATPAIRVEVQRGPTKIDITWPTAAAGECSAWLREWLK
jgi:transposase